MRLRPTSRQALGSIGATSAEPQVVEDVRLVLRRRGHLDGQVMETSAGQVLAGVEQLLIRDALGGGSHVG